MSASGADVGGMEEAPAEEALPPPAAETGEAEQPAA